MLSLADLRRVRVLKTHGILMPVRCILAAKKTGLPLALAAAVLMQETGGGRNEWGHDPTLFVGGYDKRNGHAYGETVTKQAYLAYKAQRGSTGQYGMQGVGPCQLTYYAFQDQADALGGCWKPLANMTVGFGSLAANIKRQGAIRPAVVAYNGSGARAEAYANSVLAMADRFKQALA